MALVLRAPTGLGRLPPRDDPHTAGVLGSAVAVGVSALLPNGLRLGVWTLVVLCWLVGLIVLDRRRSLTLDTSANASESLVERFDLFTIIVLGEVVAGVVGGIADAGRGPLAVVTGILGLGIGFAYWWSYFDFVGARRVAPRRGALSIWLVATSR
ncbi:MAG: low temperature requirement protein A [Terracoccus sp.]